MKLQGRLVVGLKYDEYGFELLGIIESSFKFPNDFSNEFMIREKMQSGTPEYMKPVYKLVHKIRNIITNMTIDDVVFFQPSENKYPFVIKVDFDLRFKKKPVSHITSCNIYATEEMFDKMVELMHSESWYDIKGIDKIFSQFKAGITGTIYAEGEWYLADKKDADKMYEDFIKSTDGSIRALLS